MNFSEFALLAAAFSTRSSILAAVESSEAAVVFTFRRPSRLTVPLCTSEPSETPSGSDSPVIAAVSTRDVPESTTPSSGMRSPGFTSISVPTATSSGSVFTHCPSFSTLA